MSKSANRPEYRRRGFCGASWCGPLTSKWTSRSRGTLKPSSGTRPDSLKERATFGVGGASGILCWCWCCNRASFCCCRMACCAIQAMQLLFRLTTAAKRFGLQQVVVTSPRNVCCRHELDSLRRAICQAKARCDKARAHATLGRHAQIRSRGCKRGV